jgi:hypothetical protein
MPEPGAITMLKIGDELHTCPSCGYTLGFHTSFINANVSKGNPIKSTRETWRVILICPECGARFDVGWRVSFAEFESKFVKTPVAPVIPPKAPLQSTHPSPHPVHAVARLPPPPPEDHDEPPSE